MCVFFNTIFYVKMVRLEEANAIYALTSRINPKTSVISKETATSGTPFNPPGPREGVTEFAPVAILMAPLALIPP